MNTTNELPLNQHLTTCKFELVNRAITKSCGVVKHTDVCSFKVVVQCLLLGTPAKCMWCLVLLSHLNWKPHLYFLCLAYISVLQQPITDTMLINKSPNRWGAAGFFLPPIHCIFFYFGFTARMWWRSCKYLIPKQKKHLTSVNTSRKLEMPHSRPANKTIKQRPVPINCTSKERPVG